MTSRQWAWRSLSIDADRQGMPCCTTMAETRKLAAILAADIAGYSALMGADEARTVRDLKAHLAVVLPMVGDCGGRIIDLAGDGILAEFASVVNAVECALAIQEKMAERNAEVEVERRMRFRIGINLGDVIYDEGRLYGDGINIAARLEAIAQPGGISISSKVYEEINGRLDVACEDLGPRQLKNIARPVRVYRVRMSGAAAQAVAASENTEPVPHAPSAMELPGGKGQAGQAILRLFLSYALAAIIILVLANYVMVVKLDLNTAFLRAFSLLLPLAVGFLLSRQTGLGLGAAFLLGAPTGMLAVAGMLAVVGIIDSVPIIPASAFEWQEASEYAAGITLATMAGSLLARATDAARSVIHRRSQPPGR
jgi:class 3 adenylate cyclase